MARCVVRWNVHPPCWDRYGDFGVEESACFGCGLLVAIIYVRRVICLIVHRSVYRYLKNLLCIAVSWRRLQWAFLLYKITVGAGTTAFAEWLSLFGVIVAS
jgi:hypothetical protein